MRPIELIEHFEPPEQTILNLLNSISYGAKEILILIPALVFVVGALEEI